MRGEFASIVKSKQSNRNSLAGSTDGHSDLRNRTRTNFMRGSEENKSIMEDVGAEQREQDLNVVDQYLNETAHVADPRM